MQLDEVYIAPDWLEAIRGTTFFYPSAGVDHDEALAVFQNHVATFWFCDVGYPPGLNLSPAFANSECWRLVQTDRTGKLNALMEQRVAGGRSFRFLPPSRLEETYETDGGRQLIVIRRRGFAQIALSQEFAKLSIGVFMHRGDSTGEGGSNVYYLANKNTIYEPCGKLFLKISQCLRDRALVISDGSLTKIRALKRFHNTDVDGAKAFSFYRNHNFPFGGFSWTCVGWLRRKNGPTLVWGLTRCAPTSRAG